MMDFLNVEHRFYFFLNCRAPTGQDCSSKFGEGEIFGSAINRFHTFSFTSVPKSLVYSASTKNIH